MERGRSIGCERERGHRSVVSFEHSDLSRLVQVPEANRLVRAATREQLSVRRERHERDQPILPAELEGRASRARQIRTPPST